MSRIDIVFCEVLDSESRTYIEQRIRAMHTAANLMHDEAGKRLTARALNRDVRAVTAGLQRRAGKDLPLAPALTLSAFAADERRRVKLRQACFLAEVGRRFPMLDGEHVVSRGDSFSYLSKDWAGYTKGTVVLRRTTNRSVTCYVVPDAQARKQRLLLTAAPPTGRERLKTVAEYRPQFGDAARELAMGLAGMAEPPLNLIGLFLISAYWPTGADAATDWADVYSNLQLILKDKLAADKVNTAATKVKGFVSFLTNQYVALKADPKARREDLEQALASYDVAFFLDIVNVFMFEEKPNADRAAASLANFMLGANLHIALNQERALVDPHHVGEPQKSPYAQSAANLARAYAAYARTEAPYVEKRRLAQISAVKVDQLTLCPSGMGICVTSSKYWFEDSNNGYRSQNYFSSTADKHSPPAGSQAAEARKAYVAKAKAGLNLKSQVYDVAAYWDQVAKNPIALVPPLSPGRSARGRRKATRSFIAPRH